MDKNVRKENRILEKTLDSLEVRRQAPLYVFILLLILYVVTSLTISMVAGSDKVMILGSVHIPLYTLAGVFSALSNLCIIFMVIFCGKTGFVASVIVMTLQIPMIMVGIFVRGNYTSLPGVFVDILTIIAVVVIFYNKRKLEKYQLRLREQATTDTLTGLPNGFAGTELFDELIRHNKPFAAVHIDVNDFKSINDTMGFSIGNKVLIAIASRFKEIADKGLSGTVDFISRINGDEFSLIIRGYRSDEDIVNTIKQYEAALTENIKIDGYDFFVNASFGYAVFPDDAADRDTLISCSVAAMKEIKRLGSSKHILRFFSELKAEDHLVMDNKVREAVEKDSVFFNLQPQYDISHRLRGFEVLARMKDSDGTAVSPVEFIPAAERLGLIDVLDLEVYKKAAAFFGDLIKRTGTEAMLSINVSVKHMMKSDFLDEIIKLLENSGIPAWQLEIEITESILIESAEKASGILNKLKDMGIKIAIDDFGTGYSSLSYLNSFPSDTLKIDKSFIDKMNSGVSSQKYVEAIISLAHVMDLKTVAEGVETADQLETLRGIGCDYIQGFIWGHPLPGEEAEQLVAAGMMVTVGDMNRSSAKGKV
ncbi:MAG: EAL domain-containing protein [Lachnospiraceae bacterium]|nr:EAL domain-containing protein [Lachnospiraceae bacterium]